MASDQSDQTEPSEQSDQSELHRQQQQQASELDDDQPGVEPDRIDVDDEDAVAEWATKLDVSPDQITEAVDAVGDLATDVEMHLKGTRSTTNADRLDELDGSDDEG